MSQRETVLKLLRERGAHGVSAHSLVYEHGITRGAAIIFELRETGLNIETVDEGELPDGRRRLARYILHLRPSAVLRAAAFVAEHPMHDAGVVADAFSRADTILEARPLPLPCGCVRSADGLRWESLCKSHDGTKAEPKPEVQW